MSETTTATIARLSTTEPGFHRRLDSLLDWEGVSDGAVQARVDEILADVKQRGDQAVIDATNRFDRLAVDSMEQLRLSSEQLKTAYEGLPSEQREALAVAAERIRRYHERQKPESWQYQEADGTVLGLSLIHI